MRSTILIGAALALAVAACDTSNPSAPPGPEPIEAAGTYDATFATTEITECGGLVPEGSTDGTVTVTESATTATLRLSDVTDFIRSDPRGSYDAGTGAFAFTGPVTVGDGETAIEASGTIEGTFAEDGSMDLDFDFSAFTCTVTGTITGQRRS